MDRVFSVDDIANMWKLGAGMGFPRTDSEAAFQDFLKRIPSTSNLAAQAQGLDQAQQLQLQQQVQQYQQTQQAGLHAAGSALSGGALGEVGSLNVGGIPRVPSLDLLRQLVQVNQTMSPQGHKAGTSLAGGCPAACLAVCKTLDSWVTPGVLRAEAGHAKAEPELGIPVTEGLSIAATMPLVMSGLPQTSAIPAVNAAMHHNLHGSSMQHTMRGTGGNTSDATAGSDKETNSKAEIRRARRCASLFWLGLPSKREFLLSARNDGILSSWCAECYRTESQPGGRGEGSRSTWASWKRRHACLIPLCAKQPPSPDRVCWQSMQLLC